MKLWKKFEKMLQKFCEKFNIIIKAHDWEFYNFLRRATIYRIWELSEFLFFGNI